MNVNDYGQIIVNFETQDRIKVSEFSNFLYYLKVIYSAILKYNLYEKYNGYKIEEIISNEERIRKELIDILKGKMINKSNLFKKDFGEKELFITEITKQSPLIIYFEGIILIIILALILCGGSINITLLSGTKIEIKLDHPIGEGVKLLKNAFKK